MTRINLLKPEEAAEILRISKTSIYALIREDYSFPAIKIGKGAIRIPEDRLYDWIEKKIKERN